MRPNCPSLDSGGPVGHTYSYAAALYLYRAVDHRKGGSSTANKLNCTLGMGACKDHAIRHLQNDVLAILHF